MITMTSPISVYFTANTCRDLCKYLKGMIPSIKTSKNLALFMSTIYNYADETMPTLIYRGWMYRGISSDTPIMIQALREKEWASWSTNIDIAINFAKKTPGKYKYIVCRKNKAVNPTSIKDIAKLYLEDYYATGLEQYVPSRECEVIAPMLRSECKIMNINQIR